MARVCVSGRTILSILFAGSLLSLCESSGAAASRQSKSTPQFEALPLLRSRQNHLLVRALVNERPALLIVDTGSPGTVIASKRRDHFGLTPAPAIMNWPEQVHVNGGVNKLVLAHDIQLEALDLIDVPVIVADLNGARRAARTLHEPEADGILGSDVLLATKAILDCQEQVLILNMTPEQPGHFPRLNVWGFARIPIHISEGLNSYVDSSINGTRTQLMIDTGAFATLLHRSFVHRMGIPTQRTRFESASINLAGDNVDVARIRKLSIGWINIVGKDVGVTNLESVLSTELRDARPIVGLLGAEILQSHHGIVDFGTRTLYLKR